MTQAPAANARTQVRAHPAFRAAIFDCAGLLLDSSGAWSAAFDHVAALLGYTLTAQHHRQLLGASIETAAARIARWAARPDQASALTAQIHDALRAAVDARPPQPMPGAAA